MSVIRNRVLTVSWSAPRAHLALEPHDHDFAGVAVEHDHDDDQHHDDHEHPGGKRLSTPVSCVKWARARPPGASAPTGRSVPRRQAIKSAPVAPAAPTTHRRALGAGRAAPDRVYPSCALEIAVPEQGFDDVHQRKRASCRPRQACECPHHHEATSIGEPRRWTLVRDDSDHRRVEDQSAEQRALLLARALRSVAQALTTTPCPRPTSAAFDPERRPSANAPQRVPIEPPHPSHRLAARFSFWPQCAQ